MILTIMELATLCWLVGFFSSLIGYWYGCKESDKYWDKFIRETFLGDRK